MCGWSRFAAASASALNLRSSAGEANSPERTILIATSSAQALLPGLIDNPHPAAGDFFQEFIVAEVPGLVPRRRVRRVCRLPGLGLEVAGRFVTCPGGDGTEGAAISSTRSWPAKNWASSDARSGWAASRTSRSGISPRSLAST